MSENSHWSERLSINKSLSDGVTIVHAVTFYFPMFLEIIIKLIIANIIRKAFLKQYNIVHIANIISESTESIFCLKPVLRRAIEL